MSIETLANAAVGLVMGMAGLMWWRDVGATAPVVDVPEASVPAQSSGGAVGVVVPQGSMYAAPDGARNLAAFLKMIRVAEGTDGPSGYRTLVGGGLFDSYADHPRRSIYIERLGLYSTAAGAYQILSRTWDEVRGGLPDFAPTSQDAAAIALIKRRGALEDVQAGRFGAALEKCSYEWASLPPFRYSGQGRMTAAVVQSIYENAGGVVV